MDAITDVHRQLGTLRFGDDAGRAGAAEALCELMQRCAEDPDVAVARQMAFAGLLDLLALPAARVDVLVVRALGLARDQRAVEPLVALVDAHRRGGDDAVALEALRALAEQPDVPGFMELLRRWSTAPDQVGQLAAELLPPDVLPDDVSLMH